ncbi:MAG: hypothetical protein ACYTEQ_25125, partial [Planctomycetota bacterium]
MRRITAWTTTVLLLLLGTVRVEPCELEHEVYLPALRYTIIPEQGVGATYGDCERILATGATWVYDWG